MLAQKTCTCLQSSLGTATQSTPLAPHADHAGGSPFYSSSPPPLPPGCTAIMNSLLQPSPRTSGCGPNRLLLGGVSRQPLKQAVPGDASSNWHRPTVNALGVVAGAKSLHWKCDYCTRRDSSQPTGEESWAWRTLGRIPPA